MTAPSLTQDLAAAEKTPAGWEPYTEHTETVGSAVVRLPRPGATQNDLLIQAGFDPNEWRISGPVNTRKWMRYDQEWLYYYKFDVVGGESPESVAVDVEELVKRIRKRRASASKAARGMTGNDAWAFLMSDWQIGKREGEDGTAQTVDRILEAVDLAKLQIRGLRRAGRKMPHGVLLGMGDIVEGSCGFYPNQQFLIDQNRREQARTTRALIAHCIDELGPLFDRLTVASVGGNHGENRTRSGDKVTDDGDNDDVAVFEAVAEAYVRAGEEHQFVIPDDELSFALELGGVEVGVTHGHLFKRGATAQAKAHEWWKGQDFGMQPVRGCRVLLSAHFHHLSLVSYGARTHIQAPAMDPGSRWFRNVTGEDSPAGVLTMRFDAEEALGFDDLRVLTPRGIAS